MIKTARSYILGGTPRCGSTMLCEMLWQTGAAGRPNSFYREQGISYWADKWKVPYTEGLHTPSFDRAYLAAMVREGNAGTGVFGIRIMWPSMADASKRLGRALGGNLDIAEKFDEAFGEPRYIHVSRVDKVAQAVSRLRAEQSGIWHLGADGSVLEGDTVPRSVMYDAHRIAGYVDELNQNDAAWNMFFAQRNIEPLRLSYEAASDDPRHTVGQILNTLDLDQSLAANIPLVTRKMADAESQSWVERFLKENGG